MRALGCLALLAGCDVVFGLELPPVDAPPPLIDAYVERFDQAAYVKAPNAGTEDLFGVSVALSADGTTLAIGASHEDSSGDKVDPDFDEAGLSRGAVYVYRRAGGSWQYQAFFKSEAQASVAYGERFGSAIALSADGNVLAVGAPGRADSRGVVAVYRFAASTWRWLESMTDPSGDSGHAFGTFVDLSDAGDYLVVGAPFANNGGRVLGYVGATSGGQHVVTESLPFGDPRFGAAGALSGDGTRLVVGAPGAGMALGYARNMDGSWSHEHAFTALPGSGGESVALDTTGEHLVLGAPSAGEAHVWRRTGSTWQTQQVLRGVAAGRFGASVAVNADGTRIIVGAPMLSAHGVAHVFARDLEWSPLAVLEAANADDNDYFGGAVALDATGARAAVGALFEASGLADVPSDNSAQGAGAAYVFDRR